MTEGEKVPVGITDIEGGLVALAAARDRPEAYCGLLLVSTPGRPLGEILREQLSANPANTPILDQALAAIDVLEKGERVDAADLMAAARIPDTRQRLRQYPHELSGGLCQRISIALALAARPRVLIADEPTTALDMTVQAQILDLIDAVRDQRGMAVILVSHDLAVICELAHRVLVMQDGRAIETADLADLFEAPREPYTRRLVSLARARQDGHRRMARG